VKIFHPDSLVLVGDATDILNRGVYWLGHIHCVHPQLRNGKQIVIEPLLLI